MEFRRVEKPTVVLFHQKESANNWSPGSDLSFCSSYLHNQRLEDRTLVRKLLRYVLEINMHTGTPTFPDPTRPTIATNAPLGTSSFRCFRVILLQLQGVLGSKYREQWTEGLRLAYCLSPVVSTTQSYDQTWHSQLSTSLWRLSFQPSVSLIPSASYPCHRASLRSHPT